MSPLLRLFDLLSARGLLAWLTSGMATREEESSPSKRYRDLLESPKNRGPRFVALCRTVLFGNSSSQIPFVFPCGIIPELAHAILPRK
jgi:hypothetical protein